MPEEGKKDIVPLVAATALIGVGLVMSQQKTKEGMITKHMGDELTFKCLLKFNSLRLRCATSVTELVLSWVSRSTILAGPFKFDISKCFPGHLSPGSLSQLWSVLVAGELYSFEELTVGRISPFVKFC